MSHSSDSPWGRPAGQVPPAEASDASSPSSSGSGFSGGASTFGQSPGSTGAAGSFGGPSGQTGFPGDPGFPGPGAPVPPGPGQTGPVFSGFIPPGTPYYILVPGQPGVGAGAWGAPPKQPFRKRRPFLFWGLIILAIIVGGRALMNMGQGGLPVGGANIAVVNVEGMILDPKDVLEWIETVRKSPQYKGAVIRINSPGGAVAPSQEIYQAVKRLAQVKPVAVSMADMAASGGYYIAVGGGKIFASPSTLTASIGVRLEVPNLEKLMDTIGVSSKTLTTGNLKDAGSYMRPMTPAEEAYLQGLINDMYQTFIEAVAEGRGMTLEEVRPLADGRAMTGRQALQAKLIDELGGLEEAGIYVAGLAGIAPGAVVLEHGPKKEEAWLKALMGAAFDLEAEYRARQQRTQFMY